jgi:hypothetical protein
MKTVEYVLTIVAFMTPLPLPSPNTHTHTHTHARTHTHIYAHTHTHTHTHTLTRAVRDEGSESRLEDQSLVHHPVVHSLLEHREHARLADNEVGPLHNDNRREVPVVEESGRE